MRSLWDKLVIFVYRDSSASVGILSEPEYKNSSTYWKALPETLLLKCKHVLVFPLAFLSRFGERSELWWAGTRPWRFPLLVSFTLLFFPLCLVSLLVQEHDSALLSNLLSSTSSPLFKKKSRNTEEPILSTILWASTGWLLEPKTSLMSEFPGLVSFCIFFISSVKVEGKISTGGIGSV